MTQQPATRSARIIALDPGSVRVGVAVSDELGMYAHPRPAVPGRNRGEAVREVARLIAELDVAEVVVGLPLTLSGERGSQAAETQAFVEALRKAVTVPVREVDERLSSAQAGRLVPGDEARLARAKPGRAGKRDGSLDSAAAAVMLQSLLDSRRGSR
jgi:putative Holliday junction resolvase